VAITGAKVRIGGEWVDVPGGGQQGEPGEPGEPGVGVPAGGATGQVLAKASDDDFDTEWVDQAGGGSGAVDSVNGQTGEVVLSYEDVGAAAEEHEHEISDVSGLQTALDGKAASSHTHSISNVSGLQAALDSKSGTSHTHNYQPADADLTAIGNLSPSNDDIIQRKSGSWTNRSMSQLAEDLISTGDIAPSGASPVVMLWNGAEYEAVQAARIYVGGAVDPTQNDGDIWIHAE
jgi:hypothetical protein